MAPPLQTPGDGRAAARAGALRYAVRAAFALFVVGVAFNYVWETSQAFLYVGMVSIQTIWWHCMVASLGDGLILWLIYLFGWWILGPVDWFVRPGRARYAVLLASGLALAVLIEWVALNWLHRWAYTAQMPLIPGLGLGLTPILQMLLLPPLIFGIVGRWCGAAGTVRQRG